MKSLQRSIAAATLAGLFAVTGISEASAEGAVPSVTKTALTPEAKAAFKAAKVAFHAAVTARHGAISAARVKIDAARALRDAALASATTPEAKRAAQEVFKATVASERAKLPVKPVKPIRP